MNCIEINGCEESIAKTKSMECTCANIKHFGDDKPMIKKSFKIFPNRQSIEETKIHYITPGGLKLCFCLIMTDGTNAHWQPHKESLTTVHHFSLYMAVSGNTAFHIRRFQDFRSQFQWSLHRFIWGLREISKTEPQRTPWLLSWLVYLSS